MIQSEIWACALTGHRVLPADFNINALYDRLEQFLEEGCVNFFCGMAQGFDLLALECLVDLKRKYRFTVEACIPFAQQGSRLPAAERGRYENLLSFCDKKKVFFGRYCEGCFLVRDRYMVDSGDVLLAYCKRENGGAAYTVTYAEKKGKPVVFLA